MGSPDKAMAWNGITCLYYEQKRMMYCQHNQTHINAIMRATDVMTDKKVLFCMCATNEIAGRARGEAEFDLILCIVSVYVMDYCRSVGGYGDCNEYRPSR
eukprot:44906_1